MTRQEAQVQAQAEVVGMKWKIVSDWVGDPIVFDSKEELLEALQELGVDTDAIEEYDGVLRTRAYSDRGRGGLVAEALHPMAFDRRAWIRNPDWLVLAEEVREEE